MSPSGRVAALRMAEEAEDIISEYTDAQALEDGVLAEVRCGAVNRVTSAVFYHFARPMENLPEGEERFDTAPLMVAIRAVLGVAPDEDGWRQSMYEGKELWLVPNEVRGLTLMFPTTTEVWVVCGSLNRPDSFPSDSSFLLPASQRHFFISIVQHPYNAKMWYHSLAGDGLS